MKNYQRKAFRAAALAGVAAAALASGAQAQQVYSFGDSLSDTGNVNNFSLGIVAGSDYFDGRFSNGYLWTDWLSASSTGELQRLNPGLIGPYFTRTSRPYNFAHGGAVSGELSSSVDTGLLSGLGFLSNIGAFRLTSQAKHFRDTSFFGPTFRAGAADFATISAGGNDYFAGETNVGRVVNNTMTAAGYIYDRGIRNFIILDVPNVGDTPANFFSSDRGQLNALSSSHNDQIRTAATSFENSRSGSLVAIVPAARLFELVVQDAKFNGGATYGFNNVEPGGGSSGNCLGDGLRLSACPSDYLFYDDIHPTARAHYIVADLAIASFNNKVLGLSEPLARSASAKRTGTASTQVVTSRVAALRQGFTGSGQLTNPMRVASFDGVETGSLGFQTLPGVEPGTERLSVYSFAEGEWSELAASGQRLRAAEELRVADLSLNPGEITYTLGTDLLVTPRFAIGAAMTKGLFDRERFATRSYDETTSVTLYSAFFRGPMTYTVTASSTVTDQENVRETGFEWQPFVSSDSRSRLNEMTAEADYHFRLGGFDMAAVGRVARAELELRSFEETGSDGLLDRQMADRDLSGISGYLGLRAETALPERWGLGRLTLEAGPVAGTSEELGYASVLGDAFLFGTTPDEVSLLRPFGDSARTGVFGSARFSLLATENLSLAARAAAVDTSERTDHVLELNAAWRF